MTAGVAAVAVAFGAGAATVALTQDSAPATPAASGVIDQAVTAIENHAARPVPTSRLEQAAVQGMLSALGDDWSAYYNPQDFQQFEHVLAGGYTGVGLWLRRDQNGVIRVLSVQPSSPASRAGLGVGDRIVAVAGRPVTGQQVAAVTDSLRGQSGTSVTVTVARPHGTVQTTTLSRTSILDDDVSSRMITPTVEDIRVDAFTAGVGAQVRRLVTAAQAAHDAGIVLDLRDDPGGLLDEAVETASAFLDHGPVVTYVQRGQPPQTLDALGGGNTALPLVVLVDGGTASAAEIVAAALQERDRAVLIGSRTFGKGTVQAPQRLANGSAIELTVGHYLTADGRSLQGQGITPDVLIPADTPEPTVHARAVEVLSGLTADAGSSGRG
jgi:carboxyl-terminal processing protease